MKIYNIKNNIELLRQCNFSEKEISFINDTINNGMSFNDILNFSTSNEELVKGGLFGGLTGAAAAALSSSREKRKKAIIKGLIAGGLSGAASKYIFDNAFKDTAEFFGVPDLGAAGAGALGGYIAGIYEDSL